MRPYLYQMIFGCIGSVGFAILFNVRGEKLLHIAGSSALSWFGYTLCMYHSAGIFWSFFCGTAIAALLSEILARVVKAPVLMILVPTLIPLIPGCELYQMMNYLVRGDQENFLSTATLLITESGAIALGIICSTWLCDILSNLWKRLHHVHI